MRTVAGDMNCPGCGSEIQDGDRYCRVCGRELNHSGTSESGSDRKTSVVLGVVILMALAAIAGVVLVSDGFDIEFEDTLIVNGSMIRGDIVDEVTLDSKGVLTYADGTEPVLWTYHDVSGPYLEKTSGFYTTPRPIEYTGVSLVLPPGDYEIALHDGDGNIHKGKFFHDGEVTRHYEWSAIIGGEVRTFTMDHGYMFSEYDRYADSDIVRNIRVDAMSRYVVTDGSIGELSNSLKRTYLNVMGHDSSVDGQDYVDYLLSFVQCCFSYPDMVIEDGVYIQDKTNGSGDTFLRGQTEYWMYPQETIHLGSGDCEDTSFLLASLYSAAGFDSALVSTPGHMLVSVILEEFSARSYALGYVYTVKALEDTGERLYFCETTTETFVPAGYVSPSVSDDIGRINDVVFIEGVE